MVDDSGRSRKTDVDFLEGRKLKGRKPLAPTAEKSSCKQSCRLQNKIEVGESSTDGLAVCLHLLLVKPKEAPSHCRFTWPGSRSTLKNEVYVVSVG